MTVRELRLLLAELPDDLEVFFEKVAPLIGNIQEVRAVTLSDYSFFGESIPCVILKAVRPIHLSPAGVTLSDGSFQTWDEWEAVHGPGRPVCQP